MQWRKKKKKKKKKKKTNPKTIEDHFADFFFHRWDFVTSEKNIV